MEQTLSGGYSVARLHGDKYLHTYTSKASYQPVDPVNAWHPAISLRTQDSTDTLLDWRL